MTTGVDLHKAVFGLTVETNAAELAGILRAAGRDQIPFAASLALTRTAQDAQAEMRRRLPAVFALRSKTLAGRIKVVRADKRDWPRSRAILGFGEHGRDEFWLQQETGGTKRAKGGRIAIPLRIVKRGQSGKVNKTQSPSAILSKPGGFVEEESQEIRVSPTRGRKAFRLRWYFLRKTARIKPALGAVTTSEDIQRRKFTAHFDKSLQAALRSARVRGMSFSSELGRALYLKAERSVGK